MGSFEESVERVLDLEAGYVNDPDDRGGETICGVSRVYWPDWAGWTIVDAMKNAQQPIIVTPKIRRLAQAFYREHFWDRCKCDQMGDGRVAFELFEMAVNMSVHKASTILQEALNLLNRNGTSWPELLVDGMIGPATLSAVRQINQERNGARHLADVMNALQAEHYLQLARRSPTQERFLRGWLKRT